MRPVLMIAYLFPPAGGGGVQRTLGFVKHLPRHGWRPIVVAADQPKYWARDESLLLDIPPEAEVHRIADPGWLRPLDLFRRFLPGEVRRALDGLAYVPDRQVGWLPLAFPQALLLARRHRVEAIFSTSTPYSDHLLGLALSRALKKPWIADFRDPWTQNQTFHAATPAHRAAHLALERTVYRQADLIIANTALNRSALYTDFPETREKTIHLPNGYDEDDYRGLVLPKRKPPPWVLGYAGSFYPGYGPEPLFELLEQLRRSEPNLAAQVGLRFFGQTGAMNVPEWLRPRTQVFGYLEKAQAIAGLGDCDASLVLVPTDVRPSGWVPQKLYQALRLGRPILALVPEGEVASLVRAAGGGSLALDPTTPDAATTLARWLRARLEGPGAPLDPTVVARFDRARLSQTLAENLDRLTRA